MHQKLIILKITFSVHSKFYIKTHFEREKRTFWFKLSINISKYLDKRLPVLHSKCQRLSANEPKAFVAILVPFYWEEVLLACHECLTSLITMRGVRFQSLARFLLRDLFKIAS